MARYPVLERDTCLPSQEFICSLIRREAMNRFRKSGFATLVQSNESKHIRTGDAFKLHRCVFDAFEVSDTERFISQTNPLCGKDARCAMGFASICGAHSCGFRRRSRRKVRATWGCLRLGSGAAVLGNHSKWTRNAGQPSNAKAEHVAEMSGVGQ